MRGVPEPPALRLVTSGGARDGLGHVTRCAEVARAALELGARLAFSLAGDETARRLLERAFAGRGDVCIEAWRPGEGIPDDARALLVDTRHPVRRAVEEAVRRGARTVVVDRLDFLEEVTATVLPVAHGPRIRHPRLRQGPAWCILPREVADAPAPPVGRSALLLTLGGADPLDQTGALAEHLAALLPRRAPALGALERHALLPARRCRDAGLRARLEAAGFRPHAPLPRAGFVALARRCRLAVCGFGVATYELARLGVPALHRVHRAADIPAAHRLEALGIGTYAGGLEKDDPGALDRALDRAADPSWLRHSAKRGRALLEHAEGARRIAELLLAGAAAPFPRRQEVPCRA